MKNIRNILQRAREISAKMGKEISEDHAPGKIRLGLGLAGVGAGAYSYHKSNQTAAHQAKIDQESLLALKKIHRALEDNKIVIQPVTSPLPPPST